jgi:hypothetical protein
MAELVCSYAGKWKYQVKSKVFKRGIFMDPDDSIGYRRVRTLFRRLPENKPVTMDKLGTQPLSFGFLDNHRAYLWRRPKYPVPRSAGIGGKWPPLSSSLQNTMFFDALHDAHHLGICITSIIG